MDARLKSLGGNANGVLNRGYVRVGWSWNNATKSHIFQPRIGPTYGAKHYTPWKDENFLTEINDRFIKTDLCNSFIKSTFSIYLLMLDYRKLDLQNMFILHSNSCYFEIKSQTNDSLQLVFEFWKFQVNIYLGKEQIHYANDASVRNEIEQDRFLEELDVIFKVQLSKAFLRLLINYSLKKVMEKSLRVLVPK